jgi:UDP-2,4-diacetamido-2,4,6-trideoxy-beta-L-altropyranose hydrolase
VRARCAVFRADASTSLGSGHVMRCLTLAERLQHKVDSIHFLSRTHPGNLCDLIEERGFRVVRLPAVRPAAVGGDRTQPALLGASLQEDLEQCRAAIAGLDARPSLLVVDHYAIDRRWEQALRPAVDRILVIDDLADRPHECDVLLDQNLHESPATRYADKVSPVTRVFVGPRYALLRAEFDAAAARVRAAGVNSILVFFGGADESNEALKVVDAARALGAQMPRATFVMGFANPNTARVLQAGAGLRDVTFIEKTQRMAELMSAADLALGTCGGAAWERCAVGLPALVVVSAENQREDARLLHQLGAVRNLGDARAMTAGGWAAALRAIKADPAGLERMSLAAAAVLRGRDAARAELEAALVV